MNNRQHLSGAQAIIATLQAFQVDTIFGIPGIHTLPLYDEIHKTPGMRHVLARHEQGAGFMAEGYARATGRPGVVSTITGPGLTNVATAVASAFADSIPLLVISSSGPHATASRGRGELHELKNQLGVMESLAGWARAVECVEEIPGAIQDAMRIMRSGRARGAYLQVPYDLFRAYATVTLPTAEELIFEPRRPQEADIIQAAQLLREARKPVILAGTGATMAHANQELIALAERLQAPVILGSKSHDVIPNDHPLAVLTTTYTNTELHPLLESSDLLLVVGSKLGAERTAYGQYPLPPRLVHIDIDPTVIGHTYPAMLGIVADAREALQALNTQLGDLASARPELETELSQVRAKIRQETRARFGEEVALLDSVRAAVPPHGMIVADMTMLGYASTVFLPVYEPGSFIHPCEFCTIGCGLPLALGAQVAQPERPVVALCGDGGFLLNSSELATAVQEQLPVVVVIFNDSTFTCVKTEQRQAYEGRYIATDIVEPDYVALAQAFHLRGIRAEGLEALQAAIQEGLASRRPTLIEVPLSPKPW
ncbi:thiamine pyrophosphate-binding protein [Ktedonobacter racemifer]|uniref:Thiamine pyrophosphate protein domain protein TPP-binding n=1 Tax=Ktedonobacter racemifer DSM 44963 TaxID=485913 RepID=D6TZ81_KTERA|nr:thiamine pyrophosphate-binding protein [Ktedonobacter racemifer]EFH81871.1 thiamine pyrophosphate protein domain protein TPP-binding [Ktedonobacter racemifer DSM 44963]